ncbi:MAG: hypothetical protein ACJ72N_23785 [Labedaea sp.]
MSSSRVSEPAPAWLRELAQAQARYQELLGWPVSVRVGHQNLVVAVGAVLVAIAMPAGLGERVRAQLGISILAAPIIASADGSRWTFLAKSGSSIRPAVAEDLSGSKVRLAPWGSYVVLPTGLDTTSGRVERWIESPQPNRLLPDACTIVGLTRRLTYGQRVGAAA